ncbi:putative oxidoreductase [Tahibacter aquaticus]|uniref:Putative oxidoreductase n=1 Tax=Tahibacter aquaticus TaxID=520092 RepID=A0A4R6YQZ3_9GAMM|nr:DoxX family protein [Tahibacter aquaticus]TDR40412.1 putative oxidoreductase [Tahibacter aquaticus]
MSFALASPQRATHSLIAIRLLLAGLIAAHGWARWYYGGVAPFGSWLDGLGFPLGMAIAVGVTAVEIAGTPLLAWGRLVRPLCLLYGAIYLVGIVLVHAPAGWFVVGLGRNGMEYSVLLIACLLAVGYGHAGADKAPRGG